MKRLSQTRQRERDNQPQSGVIVSDHAFDDLNPSSVLGGSERGLLNAATVPFEEPLPAHRPASLRDEVQEWRAA